MIAKFGIIVNIRGVHTQEEYITELKNFGMVENDLNKIVEINYETFLNIITSMEKNIIVQDAKDMIMKVNKIVKVGFKNV